MTQHERSETLQKMMRIVAQELLHVASAEIDDECNADFYSDSTYDSLDACLTDVSELLCHHHEDDTEDFDAKLAECRKYYKAL